MKAQKEGVKRVAGSLPYTIFGLRHMILIVAVLAALPGCSFSTSELMDSDGKTMICVDSDWERDEAVTLSKIHASKNQGRLYPSDLILARDISKPPAAGHRIGAWCADVQFVMLILTFVFVLGLLVFIIVEEILERNSL